MLFRSRQPYSVVLFDEIEKAHPDVFNMLLQILEDGRLSDAKGRPIDFTNTVVIMTSNIGAEKLQKEAGLGFNANDKKRLNDLDEAHRENKSKVQEELKKLMKPELLNRIDKVIVFRALTKKDALRILDLQLTELESRLVKHGLGLKITTGAKHWMLEKGYDAKNGVRPMRRLIQDEIEDQLASGLLEDTYQRGDVITINNKADGLEFIAVREQPTKSVKA